MIDPAAEERVPDEPTSPWWGEHRSRYHFAGPFVRGQRVLDIACGTGYGVPVLLGAQAQAVVGMDYSPTALAEARGARVAGRCALCRADGARLPVRDQSASVVTSFETLEHLHEPERFLAEVYRVLAPQGVLLLSTPNALYTRPVNGKPANPFHIKEFTPDELNELLRRYFRNVQLLGQRPSPEYEPCPYWTLPEHLPTDPKSRAKVVTWKLMARLPSTVRERLAPLLKQRRFYPGEHDFAFREDGLDRAHVLVAVCRP